jgi:two-component system, NtrC family, sensor kinase
VPRRLAQQLIISLTFIVILVEGGLGYLNIRSQERQLLLLMMEGADQLSKGITSSTWHAMLADNRGDAYEVMKTIAEKQGIDRIRMFNRDGRIMFSTKAGDEIQMDRSAEVCSPCHSTITPRVSLEARSRFRVFPGEDGRRKLFTVTPIYNEAACSQAACHAHPADTKVLGVLDVALNLDSVDREVADMQLRALIIIGAQILMSALFIVFFTRRFVIRPIGKLIEGTRAVSAMQLDRPIEIHSSEELDELARSFNIMRERLALAMSEINQFTQNLESKVEERTNELKTAHRKLLQTDRMASLGQLAASVAHEINNPVSGVLNLSMLMQRILKDDGIPPERIPEFRKYQAQVISETTRVGRIVTDLLSFSRRSKPQSSDADLNGIVKATLTLVAHKLKLGNVEVHLDLQENLPSVHCDHSQMQQVVLNLIMNGAESTQKNGKGEVWVATRVDGASATVMLEVRDNGEGIPQEIMSKIFDPFFTTKEEGKGVGLGLAVVYGIVDAHHGDIEVKSQVGAGTVFRVNLPLTRAENGAERSSRGADAAGQKD